MRTIFLFSLCLLMLRVGAQQAERTPLLFRQSVSISPLAFAELDNTALLGGEYRLKNTFSVVADAGYIYQSMYINTAKHTSGFVFRPAVRFYNPRRQQNYAQVQLACKMATYLIHDWLDKDVDNDVPSYEQLQDFRFRKQTISLNLTTGRVFRLFADKVYMDLYLGFGMKYKFQHLIDEPNSRYDRLQGEWPNLYQEKMTSLNVPMGVKVSYILK